MIQRIQTLYLFIVVLLNAVLVQWAPLWTKSSGEGIYLEHNIWVAAAFYTIAAFG
ncbi:MAG: DUF4293 family protein, partial [Flavobacteriaceae bacterium]